MIHSQGAQQGVGVEVCLVGTVLCPLICMRSSSTHHTHADLCIYCCMSHSIRYTLLLFLTRSQYGPAMLRGRLRPVTTQNERALCLRHCQCVFHQQLSSFTHLVWFLCVLVVRRTER